MDNQIKATAHSIAKELWDEKIESYNYLAKPIEDRLGSELEFLAYVTVAKLFVAIVSEAGFFRWPVLQEILRAQVMTTLDESYKRIYLLTSSMKDRLADAIPNFV